MKRAITLFAAAAAVSLLGGCKGGDDYSRYAAYHPLPKGAEVDQVDGMKLVWHDEFDVDGRPGPDWSYEKGFVRNQELQWYQEDNCFVENGTLVLEARRDTVRNPDYNPEADPRDWKHARPYAAYTSGSVNTRNSFTYKYGKLVVRAKISVAKGCWPAIWTLGNKLGWPDGGEVDLMEYYVVGDNDTPTILANVAWGGERRAEWRTTWHNLERFLAKDPDWVEKYHVWVMDWTPEEIVLSLDGEVLNRVALSETVNKGRTEGQNPFSNDDPDFRDYILLDHAIGQNGGDPSQTAFPQRYYIDYVRVYQ